MAGFNLTEEQLEALQTIFTAVFGFASAFGVQWVQKRKSKREQDNESTTVIAQAATESVKTAQTLVDLLQEMMDEQAKRFNEKIEHLEAEYSRKLDAITDEHSLLISDMESKIIKLTAENSSLNHYITKMTFSNTEKERRIAELMGQIEEMTVGLMAKVGLHEEELSKIKNPKSPAKDLEINVDE